MGLFAIDFDYTIANGHTHNTILDAIVAAKKQGDTSLKADKEKHWDLVKNIPPVGTAKNWQEIFSTLLDDGHQICIVSFNAYPHIIDRYLGEVLQLSPEIIAQIKVVAWLPKNAATANKNEHIAQAIEAFDYRGHTVVLVDDSKTNTDAAERLGYDVILADPEKANHLSEILNVSCKWSQRVKIGM